MDIIICDGYLSGHVKPEFDPNQWTDSMKLSFPLSPADDDESFHDRLHFHDHKYSTHKELGSLDFDSAGY